MQKHTWLLAIAVLLMFACPDKGDRRSNTDPTSTPSGSETVYDDGVQSDGTEEIAPTEEEAGLGYGTEIPNDDEVTSSRLDPMEEQPLSPADLDWEPIYFGFDSSTLDGSTKQRLAGYADILKRHPKIKVLIEGHCDSRGTEAYNQALGERRAESIRRYFLQLGVNEAQITTISYGELRPLVPGEGERSWSKNRRAEFKF